MNTTLQEGVKLATEVNEALKSRKPNCDVIIGVPFTHLASIKAVIDENKLGLSAENCADKTKRRLHRRGIGCHGSFDRRKICDSRSL